MSLCSRQVNLVCFPYKSQGTILWPWIKHYLDSLWCNQISGAQSAALYRSSNSVLHLVYFQILCGSFQNRSTQTPWSHRWIHWGHLKLQAGQAVHKQMSGQLPYQAHCRTSSHVCQPLVWLKRYSGCLRVHKSMSTISCLSFRIGSSPLKEKVSRGPRLLLLVNRVARLTSESTDFIAWLLASIHDCAILLRDLSSPNLNSWLLHRTV